MYDVSWWSTFSFANFSCHELRFSIASKTSKRGTYTEMDFEKYFGARLEVVLGVFGPNRKMKTEVSKMKVGVSILDLDRNDVEPPLTSNQKLQLFF